MTKFIKKQLAELQRSEYKQDCGSCLGKYEAAGIKFSSLIVARKYPYNGVWEEHREGEFKDMKYKLVWIVECCTNQVKQVEAACHLYKYSSLLVDDFGQHATMVHAPKKGDNVDETKLQRYHALLNAHNALQLSSGLI
jgi:hypothetical protein